MAVIDLKLDASKKELRVFAVLQMVFFAAICWWFTHGRPVAQWVYVVMGVSIVVGVVGITAPRAIRPVYAAWMLAVFPIGWVVSHIVLALVYFGLFTPVGWVMRLFGYDPLRRKIDRQADSYWVAKSAQRESAGYFRQF